MDRSITVIIDQRNARENSRPLCLAGPFATNVTLRDVLETPETILTRLRVSRGVGDGTVARVRRALAEWLAALRAEGAGEPADGVRRTVVRLFAATGPGLA